MAGLDVATFELRGCMKRLIAVLGFAMLASACTSDPRTGAKPQTTPPVPLGTASASEPLSSWNEGPAKKAIRDFVARVTKDGSPDFVPVPERIATFDNDGTLWAEKPLPFQLVFALDRVKALAPKHPEWPTKEPFASVLKGDMARVFAAGSKGLAEIMDATHAGTTTEEFASIVDQWITSAKHPHTGRLYADMVYQPMVELLAYLRANGFRTFIASGGGVEFMRGWTERIYGIPPEHVIGSTGNLKFEMREGTPVLIKAPGIAFFDDKENKPIAIYNRIGRRPIAAFGNSDGDLQMLQWTMAGSGPRFALFVHHDDAAREFAYDRADKLQHFDKAWDEAVAKGWTVASMKNDWRTVFPAVK
jgi:hypothetical protein